MSPTLLETTVKENLDKWEAAFADGRPEFFDEFAKDAKIFLFDRTEPINGREAYRQDYGAALGGAKREKKILNRTIQVVGDKAVVNQTARITQADTTAEVAQTIVYGLTEEGVKVLHCHTSPLGAKSAPETSVRVMHERIAVMTAASGVAQ
jgi:hypothetical protein